MGASCVKLGTSAKARFAVAMHKGYGLFRQHTAGHQRKSSWHRFCARGVPPALGLGQFPGG
jgi:hypothetical protein